MRSDVIKKGGQLIALFACIKADLLFALYRFFYLKLEMAHSLLYCYYPIHVVLK